LFGVSGELGEDDRVDDPEEEKDPDVKTFSFNTFLSARVPLVGCFNHAKTQSRSSTSTPGGGGRGGDRGGVLDRVVVTIRTRGVVAFLVRGVTTVTVVDGGVVVVVVVVVIVVEVVDLALTVDGFNGVVEGGLKAGRGIDVDGT